MIARTQWPAGAESHGPRPASFVGSTPLPVPSDWSPTLLFVVDTEEEFDWHGPRSPSAHSVHNIAHLPLLQSVLDRHGITPAYLVDHPVATNPAAVAVLRGIQNAGRCEIGAHLHPWVTPPITEAMSFHNSFAGNLPPELEWQKLETITEAVAQAFGARPTLFKAGAYGVGPHTNGFLAKLGYFVDSSVVPYTTFGDVGGPDFTDFDPQPFRTAEGTIEIPLTVGFNGALSAHGRRLFPVLSKPGLRPLHLRGIAARLGLLERLRLSPEGHGLDDMIRLTRTAMAQGGRLFMLSMHSSSLLPGATEYARTEEERDALLRRIDAFLHFFHTELGGAFLPVTEAGIRLLRDAEP